MKRLSILAMLLTVTGCTSDDMVQVAAAGLGVAGAVAGASGGGYSSSGASVARPASGAAAGVGSATGYSQRGAFEDCQRMYAAAGRPDLARVCASRATNMGSLN